MKLHLFAVGKKMPSWCQQAFQDYASRFPKDWPVQLTEITTPRRSRNMSVMQAKTKEAEGLLSSIEPSTWVVALEVKGQAWSTEKLASNLAKWQLQTRQVAFLIGGPDGLAKSCLERANVCWSLSALTFPHPLARIIVIEQLYRAWSLMHNHPYHRGD